MKKMNKYEGLFILNTQGKEEGVKDALDKISAEITALGGKIETVQKMERKPFARIADKKNVSGFYANIIFEASPATVAQLHTKFKLNTDVFRVLFTEAAEPKAVK
jgi:ribosomal protein S6